MHKFGNKIECNNMYGEKHCNSRYKHFFSKFSFVVTVTNFVFYGIITPRDVNYYKEGYIYYPSGLELGGNLVTVKI